MLNRFSIHQINAPSCCYLSQSLVAKKRHGAMQKYWKMDIKYIWDIENNGYLNARLKRKERENKVQKCFQVLKERYVSRSIVELGFHHFHHVYLHTCTSWFDCMTRSSLDLRFDFTIYALQVYIHCLHTYELHISLSCKKRENTQHHFFCLTKDL
jgi:hypothetical protein